MNLSLAENLARVQDRLLHAAASAGHRQQEIRLVAVTKGCDPRTVRELWELGVRDFGENRVQEALQKVDTAPPEARWHLVGHLQENKINKVVPWVHMIQSLDSLALALALDQRARRLQRRVPVLVEVKTAPESTKHGFDPAEVPDAYAQISALAGLDLQGLMTIGPLSAEESVVRQSFRNARRLFDRLQSQDCAPRILSMGMSGDLEIAVEEGATMVRVGRALVAA